MVKLIKKVLIGVGGLLIVILIIRLSFFDVFHVPSESMEMTLKPGDLVIINKTLYSGIFSGFFSSIKVNSQPESNDIVVFKVTAFDTAYYVKRCICTPGKTIEIKDAKVFINGKYLDEIAGVVHQYKLWYNNYDSLATALDRLKIDLSDNRFRRFPKYAIVSLEASEKKVLDSKNSIDSITVVGVGKSKYDDTLSAQLYKGALQNLKSIRTPFVGMKIKLDSQEFDLYKDILKSDENVIIKKKGVDYFVNGQRCTYYVFKKDYYFMMGDNREMSRDSRVFGFIPKDCIEGKVIAKI